MILTKLFCKSHCKNVFLEFSRKDSWALPWHQIKQKEMLLICKSIFGTQCIFSTVLTNFNHCAHNFNHCAQGMLQGHLQGMLQEQNVKISRIVFYILLHIYPPITRKRSMRYTSSLRSCQPSVYHTKMGESH